MSVTSLQDSRIAHGRKRTDAIIRAGRSFRYVRFASLDGSRDVRRASERIATRKIEQLLLVGLDHYFAAQYEQAINVWTRALFLDRSHARARAYIERARSALAERQRESEELLHDGVAAFQRGDGDEARRLLQAAIDSGAPSDEALAVLDRLDRLERRRRTVRTCPWRRGMTLLRTRLRSHSRSWRGPLIAVGALLAVATAITSDARVGACSGVRSIGANVAPADVASRRRRRLAHDAGLPLPRRGETALGARAGLLRSAVTCATR